MLSSCPGRKLAAVTVFVIINTLLYQVFSQSPSN